MEAVLAGVILAAGRSSRMGRAKALLPFGPRREPFVVCVGRTLLAGGVGRLLIVGRADDPDLQRVISEHLPSAAFIANARADAGGQLSSLVAAIDACDQPETDGLLATPVDMPAILPSTIAALVAVFATEARARIVRAVHGGRHGHPVIFPRTLFDELREADPARGAKAVLEAHADLIVNVEVPDAGTIDDIDTPEDFERLNR